MIDSLPYSMRARRLTWLTWLAKRPIFKRLRRLNGPAHVRAVAAKIGYGCRIKVGSAVTVRENRVAADTGMTRLILKCGYMVFV